VQHENGVKREKSIDTELQVAKPEAPKAFQQIMHILRKWMPRPLHRRRLLLPKDISHDQLAKEVLFLTETQEVSRREKRVFRLVIRYLLSIPQITKRNFPIFPHTHTQAIRKKRKPFAVRPAINIKLEMELKDPAHGGQK